MTHSDHAPVADRLRRDLRRLAPVSPAALALGLLALCRVCPWYAENVHARVFFPVFASVFAFFSSRPAFCVTEILAFTSPLLLAGLILLVKRAVRRAPDRRRAGRRAARGTLWALSTLFLVYMLMHGLNYYRAPLSELYRLDLSAKSPEFLQSVVIDLAEKANALRETLPEDADGLAALPGGKYAALEDARAVLAPARAANPLFADYGAHPKWVLHSRFWSYTGITGFYSMPLCEPCVNTDQPAFTLPFSVAHELAHTSGFAREDEANFAAFLLCKDADSPSYRYAAYFMAYIYCSNALYDYDQDLWAETRAHVHDALAADLDAQSAYWRSFDGPVKETGTSVNDVFLKLQSQEDGVLSYDRVVALILGYYAS